MIKKLILTFILCVISWPVFAATNVYYSISPFGTGDIKVACNISISGGAGVATFSNPQTGNIGVGDHVISANVDGFISVMTNSTTAMIVTALGAAHGNVSSESLTSIAHEFASLAAFEAAFTDASHINNASLVAADVVANAPCYYNHTGSDADTSDPVLDWTGTTGTDTYLRIYTPEGGTESINNQRLGDGIYDETFYHIHNNDSGSAGVYIRESFVRFEGIQVKVTGSSTNTRRGLVFDTIDASSSYFVDKCIVKGINSGTGTGQGIGSQDANNTLVIRNSTVEGFDRDSDFVGIFTSGAGSTVSVFNSTISDCYYGMRDTGGTTTIKNSASFNNVDDIRDVDTIDYCATDDGDGTNSVDISPGGTEVDDWNNAFTDYSNGDFSVKNSSSVLYNAGTDLSGDGVTDDIIGTARPQDGTEDIGAFELPAAAVSFRPRTRWFQ